ncbi:hypothetical protein BDV97DRAFT_369189 [Delphinella strobiligena]|nr:hypothetical protein BDV97DRAFT_369189 [Delphinella strobiligena]
MGDVGVPVGLRDLLLATGTRELVEASRFDRVWGIGFDALLAASTPREKWGENLLGEALMRVRERIRGEMEDVTGPTIMIYEREWIRRSRRVLNLILRERSIRAELDP